MGHYWKKCPHCGRTIEEGHGLPFKQFGEPKKQCRFCYNTYIDRDIIDWTTASLFKKFLFCLANGRLFLCIIPSVLVAARINSSEWWVYLFSFLLALLMFALCVAYVKLRVWITYGNVGRKEDKDKYQEYLNKYQNGLFDHHNPDNNKK